MARKESKQRNERKTRVGENRTGRKMNVIGETWSHVGMERCCAQQQGASILQECVNTDRSLAEAEAKPTSMKKSNAAYCQG
jgi:hypothetical protein